MVVVVVVVMYLRHDLSLASFVYAVQRSKVDRGIAESAISRQQTVISRPTATQTE